MSEDQINPSHYQKHPSGMQAIDLVEQLGFNIGNAIKYIWRAGLKGGEARRLEDYKKARWYLERQHAGGLILPLTDRAYATIERVRTHEAPGSVLNDVLYQLVMGAAGPTYVTRGNTMGAMIVLDSAISQLEAP